jgi:hypothetical protein
VISAGVGLSSGAALGVLSSGCRLLAGDPFDGEKNRGFLDARGRQARRGRLRQGNAVAGEPQRHEHVDGCFAAPGPAVAGAETGLVDEPFLLQLDDLLVGAQLPQLHAPPQQDGRHRREHPAGEADALHVLVGGGLTCSEGRPRDQGAAVPGAALALPGLSARKALRT